MITVDRSTHTAEEVDILTSAGGAAHSLRRGGGEEYEYGEQDLEGLEVLLQHSTLANELRHLYHSLVGGHSVVLSINQVLDLNVRLVSKSDSLHAERGRVMGLASPEVLHELCALMTILPVGGEDDMLAFLQSRRESGGSSPNPRLLSLLYNCNVTRSILELSADLEFSPEEIYDMGDHLRSWGLALLMPVLTKRSVLQVHEEACLDAYGPTAMDFDSVFLGASVLTGDRGGGDGVEQGGDGRQDDPWEETEGETTVSQPPYNLFCVMAAFDGARPLSQAVKLLPEPLQEHALDIVVWLLRRKMLFIQDPRHAQRDRVLLGKLKQRYPLE